MVFTLLGCSLQQDDYSSRMGQLCIDYTIYLKNSEFRDKKVLINLREEESGDGRYIAYRVAAEPAYLPEGLIPDRVDEINGYVILYFLKNEATYAQKESIKNDLMKRKLYNEIAYKISSNYPEWVILIDNQNKSSQEIKDAWYRPLNDLEPVKN